MLLIFRNSIPVILLVIYLILNFSSCGTTKPFPEAGPPKSSEFPKFPWPPPKASASLLIHSDYLLSSQNDSTTFEDVNNKISDVLDKTGYFDKSYYSVPDGFAIVTRLEQYNEDGTIKELPSRWETDYIADFKFDLIYILESIFTANLGYYRIIVFIITPHPFSQSNVKPTEYEVLDWLYEGFNWLPPEIGSRTFTDAHRCTALIYEFEHFKNDEQPVLRVPSRLIGKIHLEKNEIWKHLKE